MKKIAEIPFGTDDPAYDGGIIVALTREEAKTIAGLQLAIDGNGWDSVRWEKADREFPSGDLSPIFKLIRRFAAMKFYINDMRLGVEEMNDYLMTLEEGVKEK